VVVARLGDAAHRRESQNEVVGNRALVLDVPRKSGAKTKESTPARQDLQAGHLGRQ
jgi:hypothetical protein